MAIPSFIKTDLETWLKGFNFHTLFRTRFSETDAFGHVNNVSYFTYFEQARLDYFDNLKMFEALGIDRYNQNNENIVVTANLECHYLAQLYYGQEIEVYVKASSIGRSSFELQYCLIEKEQELIAAVGRGSVVYINRKTGKSEPLPQILKDKLINYDNIPV